MEDINTIFQQTRDQGSRVWNDSEQTRDQGSRVWNDSEQTRDSPKPIPLPSFMANFASKILKNLEAVKQPETVKQPALFGRNLVEFSSYKTFNISAARPVYLRYKDFQHSMYDMMLDIVHESTEQKTHTTTVDKCIPELEEGSEYLEKHHHLICKLDELVSHGKSLSKEEQEAVSQHIGKLERLERLFVKLMSVSAACASMCHFPNQEIVDPHDEQQRYLCVCDGFTICCLDLKQSQQVDECKYGCKVPSKISTLKVGEGLPFSLGLFKVGSLAYMVGGPEFPDFKEPDLLGVEDHCSDLDVLIFLHDKYAVKGGTTSRTFHLTLADGRLCLSKCDIIGSTKMPKLWPIVEKVEDQIHVIEALPSLDRTKKPYDHPQYRLEFTSHEVLSLDQDQSLGWTKLSSPLRNGARPLPGLYIRRYLVFGSRMYASDNHCPSKEFAVFDTKTEKWELHAYSTSLDGMLSIKHVAELTHPACGFGRCVGEFPLHGGFRGPSPPLYVVVAVGKDIRLGMIAVAYLVAATGQVICYQRLNHFFEGVKKRFDIRSEATVISCGGGGSGCAIVRDYGTNDVFITSFTLEAGEDALAVDSDLRAKMRDNIDENDLDKLPVIEEEDFVEVVAKGQYVTQLQNGLRSARLADKVPTRLTACFL